MDKVVSLFSGGGGLDLGFKESGYKIIWANDIDKNAVSTYKKNIGSHIIKKDINKINIESIPNSDIIIGGPPCQSFSLAGNRDSNDKRGKLVWKYLEILEKKKPKIFLFENVTGITSAKTEEGKKVLEELIYKFNKIGYNITWKKINTANYGIPQKRKRVIIIGVKHSYKQKYSFPKETHSKDGLHLKKHVSVKEALGDLPKASLENKSLKLKKMKLSDFQRNIRNNAEYITEQFVPTMSKLDKYIVKHVTPGGNYMDIPDDVPSKRIKRLKKEGGRTTCYGRLSPEKPSYTINTYFNRPNVGCNIHYKFNRLITVREAMRLQTFPDTYKLVSSSKTGKRNIVGNAVPPLLAKKLAKSIKKLS